MTGRLLMWLKASPILVLLVFDVALGVFLAALIIRLLIGF